MSEFVAAFVCVIIHISHPIIGLTKLLKYDSKIDDVLGSYLDSYLFPEFLLKDSSYVYAYPYRAPVTQTPQ